MDSIYSVLGWGSPIGTGLFLVFLGLFVYLLSRSDNRHKK